MNDKIGKLIGIGASKEVKKLNKGVLIMKNKLRNSISNGIVLGTAVTIVTKSINPWLAAGFLISAALISSKDEDEDKKGKDN
ncbi:hypothetical protein [Lagierella sp.]|uniref:hypothetical protein n=1 Tax=Lagierella sp. TaxID=2849657 RepID=UPI0026174567|nr:hypothetical protein [Lagierella sp.]